MISNQRMGIQPLELAHQPVLSLVKVTDLKEGIALANKSEFANGACLFTDSASSIRYFREFIDAGMLGINLGVPFNTLIYIV